jgi:hypothetical protein
LVQRSIYIYEKFFSPNIMKYNGDERYPNIYTLNMPKASLTQVQTHNKKNFLLALISCRGVKSQREGIHYSIKKIEHLYVG